MLQHAPTAKAAEVLLQPVRGTLRAVVSNLDGPRG